MATYRDYLDKLVDVKDRRKAALIRRDLDTYNAASQEAYDLRAGMPSDMREAVSKWRRPRTPSQEQWGAEYNTAVNEDSFQEDLIRSGLADQLEPLHNPGDYRYHTARGVPTSVARIEASQFQGKDIPDADAKQAAAWKGLAMRNPMLATTGWDAFAAGVPADQLMSDVETYGMFPSISSVTTARELGKKTGAPAYVMQRFAMQEAQTPGYLGMLRDQLNARGVSNMSAEQLAVLADVGGASVGNVAAYNQFAATQAGSRKTANMPGIPSSFSQMMPSAAVGSSLDMALINMGLVDESKSRELLSKAMRAQLPLLQFQVMQKAMLEPLLTGGTPAPGGALAHTLYQVTKAVKTFEDPASGIDYTFGKYLAETSPKTAGPVLEVADTYDKLNDIGNQIVQLEQSGVPDSKLHDSLSRVFEQAQNTLVSYRSGEPVDEQTVAQAEKLVSVLPKYLQGLDTVEQRRAARWTAPRTRASGQFRQDLEAVSQGTGPGNMMTYQDMTSITSGLGNFLFGGARNLGVITLGGVKRLGSYFIDPVAPVEVQPWVDQLSSTDRKARELGIQAIVAELSQAAPDLAPEFRAITDLQALKAKRETLVKQVQDWRGDPTHKGAVEYFYEGSLRRLPAFTMLDYGAAPLNPDTVAPQSVAPVAPTVAPGGMPNG